MAEPPEKKVKTETEKSKLKLIYYDGRGPAELTRTLLALAGKFPGGGYENCTHSITPGDTFYNYEAPTFKKARARGDFTCSLGRVPLLEVEKQSGGVTAKIGQSHAIARYVARTHGLMGRNEEEAAQIDMICEHVRDMNDAFVAHKKSGSTLQEWFTISPEPEKPDRSHRKLQWFLGALESCISETSTHSNYAVGESVSLADAALFQCVGEACLELKGGMYESLSEPFGDMAACNRAMEEHAPRIRRIVQELSNIPAIVKWHKVRGTQKF